MRGVFFDLYGTLLIYGDMKSAWSDWLIAFYSELKFLGLSISLEFFSSECDRFFGKEISVRENDGFTVFESRIQRLCDRLGITPSADEVGRIADQIAGVWEQHVRVDAEAAMVLCTLRSNKTLALVSNFDHPRHVKKVISNHQLTGFFESIVISGDVGVSKPDPRIFDVALEQTGLSPSEVVYVGDTAEDVTAARAAGIAPILIQRQANATDPNTLDFRSYKDVRALDCNHTLDVDVTKVTSLKELLPLIL